MALISEILESGNPDTLARYLDIVVSARDRILSDFKSQSRSTGIAGLITPLFGEIGIVYIIDETAPSGWNVEVAADLTDVSQFEFRPVHVLGDALAESKITGQSCIFLDALDATRTDLYPEGWIAKKGAPVGDAFHYVALVPLKSSEEGHLHGIILSARRSELYSVIDLQLLEDFGSRIALALDVRVGYQRGIGVTDELEHKLRQPVSALLLEASLLEQHADAVPPEVRRVADMLIRDLYRLRELFEDFLGGNGDHDSVKTLKLE